jgi:hypothetical protein
MQKALDPVQNADFNQKHPRAAAGNAGLRPGQFAPKSEAEKLADEAEQVRENEEAEEEESRPAESTTVQVGNNEEDAQEAVATDHANNLRKSAEVTAEAVPHLIVVFGDRASATKFAIACDHAQENAATTRVEAAANGAYHVAPVGMTAQEIDQLQSSIHAGVPLSELTMEPVAEPVEEQPVPEGVVNTSADQHAITSGLEEGAREYLQDAVNSGKVTTENIDEVLSIARGIRDISMSRDDGFLPVCEAIHYGSYEGLRQAADSGDLDGAARARVIMGQIGMDQVLAKGATMGKQMHLLPIDKDNDVEHDSDTEHDSMENDGKALPLGSHERVTDKVGSEPTITQPTAKYPKTGHKPARRPRLILNR